MQTRLSARRRAPHGPIPHCEAVVRDLRSRSSQTAQVHAPKFARVLQSSLFMPDAKANNSTQTHQAPHADVPVAPSPPPRSLARVWQIPALVLGLTILVSGLITSILTAPKPDIADMFPVVEELIALGEYEPALQYLNSRIRPYVGTTALDDDGASRFHRLRAAAITLGQRKAGVSVRANHEAIVGEFRRAESLGAALSPEEHLWCAEACVALGLLDHALERADRLVELDPVGRTRILRAIVERRIGDQGLDPQATLRILAQFLTDPALHPTDRAWAETRQAAVLIDMGYAQDAVRKILRTLPAYLDADPGVRADLLLLLGRAYLAIHDEREAQPHVERALSLLEPSDPRRADGLLSLARIAEAAGDIEQARSHYTEILTNYPMSAAELPAMRGLADVEAAAGKDDDALAVTQALIVQLRAGRAHPDVTHERVVNQLLSAFADRFASRQTEAALRYAMLAEELTGPDAAPPRLMRAIADGNRRLADELIEAAGGFERGRVVLVKIDPATREQVRERLLIAGNYYRATADRMVLIDAASYADALWLAGDCFDRAGNQESAVLAFGEYVSSFTSDPRQAEARFRLAQAHQAKGDYVVAADYYKSLIEERGGPRAGPFADMSYVPLARCYLVGAAATESDELRKQAEDILLFVVGGGLGNPDSPHFTEAMLELGDLNYASGNYSDAIRRLEEGLTLLAADDPRRHAVRYRLGDSHRLEGAALARQMELPMPEWERREKEEARQRHLARAIDLFQQVRNGLLEIEATRLSLAERMYLRNSHFYLGDCAFDLGDFATAIRYYDTAREQHPRDPASLVAMIQIVNAYLAQGDHKRAWTANERARRFYSSLPPSVWDDPNLPMSDRDWVRWLDASAKLAEAEGRTTTTAGAVFANEPN